ncbi:hypothetical protein LguiB_028859 [Lonicera macranthoides]
MAFANEYNNIQMLMKLGLCEDYWKIIKVLTQGDVNHRHCRLLLPRSCVEKHILRSIQRRDADRCSSADGLPIKVWDMDESHDEYVLCLKQCPSTNSYVLTGRWILDFVTRKRLKEGDKPTHDGHI